MALVVHKYGGSSLARIDQIHAVAARVAAARESGDAVLVVVSARGDTTDRLLRLAREVNPEQPGREIDQLLATGECASAALLACALHRLGTPAVSLTGGQAGVLTSDEPGHGVIERIEVDRVLAALVSGQVAVVTGFQGVNSSGDVVTLGRGGSDTSAVAFAAALRADRCEIYTDVDGIYTADPRIVPGARHLRSVPSRMLTEMAVAGARVLHPRAAELAALRRVDLRVGGAHTGNPGTFVLADDGFEDFGCVVAVAHDRNLVQLIVHAPRSDAVLPGAILTLLAEHAVAVDFVSTVAESGRLRMSYTVSREDETHCRDALAELVAGLGGRVERRTGIGRVSLIGTGLLTRAGYAARAVTALTGAGIGNAGLAMSQHRVSLLVDAEVVGVAAGLLHEEFRLDEAAREQIAA